MSTHRTHTIAGEHAIVVGGSMAGLLAARVLSEHFTHVTLIERDRISDASEPRRGVPQGRHLHALLARGLTILSELFPGLDREMVQDGAIPMDMGNDLVWYQFGGYRTRFESEFTGLCMTRPFLEAHVRQRVLALPNVHLMEETDLNSYVTSVDYSQVTGVRIQRRQVGAVQEELRGDLVVDATGRGSQNGQVARRDRLYAACRSRWSRSMSAMPRASIAATLTTPCNGKAMLVYPTPPVEKRMGAMFGVEGDRWVVTWAAGRATTGRPMRQVSWRSCAACRPRTSTTRSLRSTPISDIVLHKLPSNLRRHYERLSRFPERFIVLGDAVCSFNPIYGQGMTSAALQALALDETLAEQESTLAGLPKRFFRRAAKVIDTPWAMAAGEDFRFKETEGKKAPGTDLLNGYVTLVHHAAQQDVAVQRTFLQVMNMMAPPTALLRPGIVWRVVRHALWHQPQAPAVAAGRGVERAEQPATGAVA